MDFYEIRIFPIGKTIERQYMASYRFDIVGDVPYQKHMKSIYGPWIIPYHTTQFGEGMNRIIPWHLEKCVLDQ